MEESNPELESFRQKWREEVKAKVRTDGNKPSTAGPSRQPRRPGFTKIVSNSDLKTVVESKEHDEIQGSSGLDGSSIAQDQNDVAQSSTSEPRSALEHYEKAVEKETQGSLGDSLNLYRKAFRMDHRVDQKYKTKHFPPSSVSKSLLSSASDTSATGLTKAQSSSDAPPQTITELLASFSGLSIQPAPPTIQGTSAPQCPLADLPEEIIVQILTHVAILDVASFVRLARVCKKMAYLVSTEEQIWKRVCLGSEVGFGAMHYEWQREVLGGLLIEEPPDLEDTTESDGVPHSAHLSPDAITGSLLQSAYKSSWHQMFRLRPRIRFNGCYISTVNYIRPGQASPSQVTWSSPIHVVTYYRYLRFFRDGTVISLCSTAEPADVVHHLTKDLQETHRGGAASYLPSNMMEKALRGRWRLSSIKDDNSEGGLSDAEGDVFVETEGANEKYMYRMKLSLRSAGKGVRNNKMVWRGFWNYNVMTDDTGEFTLRNDKAFFWSRVKSYGSGA